MADTIMDLTDKNYCEGVKSSHEVAEAIRSREPEVLGKKEASSEAHPIRRRLEKVIRQLYRLRAETLQDNKVLFPENIDDFITNSTLTELANYITTNKERILWSNKMYRHISTNVRLRHDKEHNEEGPAKPETNIAIKSEKQQTMECSEQTSNQTTESSCENHTSTRDQIPTKCLKKVSKRTSESSGDNSISKKKPKCSVTASHLTRPKKPYWAKATDEDPPYADWKLNVKYYDANKGSVAHTACYSIHRMILGHKSDHFDRIFRGGFSDCEPGQSCHQMEREHCESGVVSIEHFEELLNWLYSKKLKFTPDSSVGILCLCDYFCIEDLKEQVWSYIRQRLKYCSNIINDESSYSLAIFYRGAKVLGASILQQEVAELCVRNPSYLSSKFCLNTKLQDVDLWIDVFKAKTNLKELRSTITEVWSRLFSEFVRKFPASVDPEQFEFLTSKDMLPIISSDVALSLMEQQLRLNGSAVEKVLTCLQGRCIRALFDPQTGKWNVGPDSTTRIRLKKLSPVVLSEILMQSISFDGKESNEK